MKLTRTIAPVGEPLSVEEVKLHLRLDTDEDDALIAALITVAREQAEHQTGLLLMAQTWVLEVTAGEQVSLAKMLPVQDLQTTVPYLLDGNWPPTLTAEQDAQITVRCGFGTAEDVPPSIKQWMLLQIAGWYEHREAIVAGNPVALPRTAVDALLDAWTVPRC